MTQNQQDNTQNLKAACPETDGGGTNHTPAQENAALGQETAFPAALEGAPRLERNPPPVVLVDTREQRPLPITAFPTVRQRLREGDYSIAGFGDRMNPAFTVERKSLNDLAHSMGRGRRRFLAEIERLRLYRFKALLIEGTEEQVAEGQYPGVIAPASILGTLNALAVRAGVHVFWCGNAEGAARKLEALVRAFVVGVERDYARLRGAA